MINFKLIGQRIKKLRLEKGYTQEAFSEVLDISIEHLSRIETGAYRPSLGLIEKISAALNVNEQELMFGGEANTENKELANKIECLSPEKRQALHLIIDLIEN